MPILELQYGVNLYGNSEELNIALGSKSIKTEQQGLLRTRKDPSICCPKKEQLFCTSEQDMGPQFLICTTILWFIKPITWATR
jgi:hypothetical protein